METKPEAFLVDAETMQDLRQAVSVANLRVTGLMPLSDRLEAILNRFAPLTKAELARMSGNAVDPDAGCFLVAVGNPFDGIALYGPFPDHDGAVQWAEGRHDSWYVTVVEAP
jgi:hypothetical protein